ncbi:hypothetical protein BDV97DRAFT_400517 [Delphinella strobiligena]|nr:hypothetical protein BDV97DRAFT_400517 [Delphinella strobiligena]
MTITYFFFALAGIAYAAPWSPLRFPGWTSEHHPNHPGWTESHPYVPSHLTATGGYTSPSPTATSISTSVASSAGACATVSYLVASFRSAHPSAATATLKIPAQVAYDCLHEIPFNSSAAVALIDSIRPYLNWQTTISYLKSPPEEYAEKIQPPYDFEAILETIYSNATAGSYASEYDFGWDLYKSFQNAHDNHFSFLPDSVADVFTFGRTTPLVSLSVDGESIPQPYVYADVLAASSGNASFTPSYITEIDGEDATDYLLDWSQCGSHQDRDALWNNLFYSPAQISKDSSGTGTFVGGGGGGGGGYFVFPGPTTTLTFANGTTVANGNFARVLIDFKNITTGADIYAKYFAPPAHADANALEIVLSREASTRTSNTSAVSTSPRIRTSTPPPGYPNHVVRHSENFNSGYFLSGTGFNDVAVLSVQSFDGRHTDGVEFQNVNSELIAAALDANKTKLIIDLFPNILPYGAARFRAHEAFDLIGQEASYLSGLWPRSVHDDAGRLEIESSEWNYRNNADINYEPFTSWTEKYGPHEHGPANDNFTSIIRWNLSDVLIPHAGGIYVSGYLNRSNVTTQPFAAENVIIVYDGYCASTCTIFSELMRQQAGVKTIALGGRPNTDIIQAVGGVKGTHVEDYDYIIKAVEMVFQYGNSYQRDLWNKTSLGTYSALFRHRSRTIPVVNARDGIRQDDLEEVPLQFRYEPANCRIFYTKEMVLDETAVWKTVADIAWNGKASCVAGGIGSSNSTVKRKTAVASKRVVETGY